jgi:hypothetical protein
MALRWSGARARNPAHDHERLSMNTRLSWTLPAALLCLQAHAAHFAYVANETSGAVSVIMA